MNYIKIFMLLAVFIPSIVLAQGVTDLDRGGRPNSLLQQGEKSESEKVIEPKIKLWYLNGYGAFKDSSKLDTLQDYFHLYHPVYKNTLTASYVGNYATPYLDNNFFNREREDFDFYFFETRYAYLLTPKNVQYYNTTTPYTLLDFSQSENKSRKNETRFNVLHTQNINPYWNITFRYDQARSAGQYKNQDSKNHFVTLYSSYTKDEWNLHGGFISNRIQNNENGGLHKDADLLGEPDTDFLDVNLTNVNSKFSNNYFFVNGEYRFGRYIDVTDPNGPKDENGEIISREKFNPLVGLLYSFELQNNKKEYLDEEEIDNGFFKYAYFGDRYTKDSIRFNKIKNILQLKHYENPLKKWTFGKRVFIGQEHVSLSTPGSEIGLLNYSTHKYSNVYLGGGIFRQTGKFWKWNFDGRFFMLGRNIGQTEINGVISKPLPFLGDSLALLSIKGKLENKKPDYFQEKFFSNRIRWDDGLKMEQRMTVNGNLNLPSINMDIGANYALINNFIFNDTLGVPKQFSGQLLVLSAFADKDFCLRNFHFRTRLLWQKVSDESVLHLPDFSAFISTYYKFVVSKVLFSQIGVDVRYNTEYYADAYHPTTGMFFLQNREKIGNFPYIDVYANLRLKRTRLFFKLMNVGTEFMNKEYYTTPRYPMNRMTFRMGVAWAFYD